MSPESQKIKILAMKLSSLREEIKTMRETANSASLEVDKLYYKKYKKPPKEFKNKINLKETQKDKEKIQQEEKPPEPPIDSNTKKAFRKIALRTHPDKLIGMPEGSEKVDKIALYQKASKALEEGDLVTLASITIDLGLEPPEIPDSFMKKATDEIKTIKDQINHIESTYVWKWFFSSDKEEKKQLLEKMFEMIYERNKKHNPGS